MGYYESAVAQMARDRQAATLVCPHCGEANRKGSRSQVELDEDGLAFCNTCRHGWKPGEEREPRC